MNKNASFGLGDHFDAFVAAQVAAGRYRSAIDVIRSGPRLLVAREARDGCRRETSAGRERTSSGRTCANLDRQLQDMGERQADRNIDELDSGLRECGTEPAGGRRRDEVALGCRSNLVRSHGAYFTVTAEAVLTQRLLLGAGARGSTWTTSSGSRRMERVMGIEPTTFSLGRESGGEQTASDGAGKERTNQDAPTASAELEGPTCECDPDT